MERHDREVVDLDPRAIIRINALVELKFFVMTLLYQHRNQNNDNSEA